MLHISASMEGRETPFASRQTIRNMQHSPWPAKSFYRQGLCCIFRPQWKGGRHPSIEAEICSIVLGGKNFLLAKDYAAYFGSSVVKRRVSPALPLRPKYAA